MFGEVAVDGVTDASTWRPSREPYGDFRAGRVMTFARWRAMTFARVVWVATFVWVV